MLEKDILYAYNDTVIVCSVGNRTSETVECSEGKNTYILQ
jgi:hypothetical protein